MYPHESIHEIHVFFVIIGKDFGILIAPHPTLKQTRVEARHRILPGDATALQATPTGGLRRDRMVQTMVLQLSRMELSLVTLMSLLTGQMETHSVQRLVSKEAGGAMMLKMLSSTTLTDLPVQPWEAVLDASPSGHLERQ